MDRIQRVRKVIPVRAVPWLVKRRGDKAWQSEAYRASAEAQMRFLLEFTDRADEIPVLARKYVEQVILRGHMRYHPRAITKQPVRDIEWITTKRDTSRPVIMSFAHHARFEGMWLSLKRQGAVLTALGLAEALAPDAPELFYQHMKVCALGTTIIPTGGGLNAILDLLEPGMVMGIAGDLPGKTPIKFLGRDVLAASGTARVAMKSNSPVVLVTHERDDAGVPYIQVHPPIEPSDFSTPEDLIAEILLRHSRAFLAWPEAVETPIARFATVDD
jgi:lauroyl/myristoyl acyltransferase